MDARRGHLPNQRPFSGEHVVELGGVQSLIAIVASGEKNSPIAQHNRCSMDAARVHVSPGDELLRLVVVNLATGEHSAASGDAAGDQNIAVGQGRGRMALAWD